MGWFACVFASDDDDSANAAADDVAADDTAADDTAAGARALETGDRAQLTESTAPVLMMIFSNCPRPAGGTRENTGADGS